MHRRIHSRDQLRPRVQWVGLREGKARSQEKGGGGPSGPQEGMKREAIMGETLGSRSHLGLPLNTGLGEADQTEGRVVQRWTQACQLGEWRPWE